MNIVNTSGNLSDNIMKVKIQQWGLNGLESTVENIDKKFQKDTNWKLPKYKSQFLAEDVDTEVKYNKDKELYELKISICRFPKNLIGYKYRRLQGLLYHEFTHMIDDKVAQTLNIPLNTISSFSEIHASIIEMKYFCNGFKKEYFHSNLLFPSEIGEISLEDFLDRSITEIEHSLQQKRTKAVHILKVMQYLMGQLKYVEMHCEESVETNIYIDKLTRLLGDMVPRLYQCISYPYQLTKMSAMEANVFSLAILDNLST